MTNVLTCLALSVILGSACKESRDVREHMPEPSKAPPAGFDVDTARRPEFSKDAGAPSSDARSPTPKKTLAFSENEIAQLAGRLPTMSARTLKKLAGVSRSRVAVQTICMEEPLGQATTLLVRGFRSKKWQDVLVGTSASKTRRTMTANSPRFRVTATISVEEKNVCSETATHSKVILRFQERVIGASKPKTSIGPALR